MKILFIYPAFERHAQSHPELKSFVPCNEYIGPPSLGIASVAACTPPEHQVAFLDDRIHPLRENHLPEADLYALSFFTPAATRAVEIGKMLRQTGRPVMMGGIFPTMMPDEVAPYCDTIVIGEGEPVWPQIVEDLPRGNLKPRYQADRPADLSALPAPRVELYLEAEDQSFSPDDYPLQLSRGCPFACTSCVVPAVMGRKIRHFPIETVWETLTKFAGAGKVCSLTEDTSFMFVSGARRRFRAFLKKLIESGPEINARLSYIGTSMPLLLNVEEGVLEEARRSGIDRFYLVCGFDPVTQQAFGQGDRQATLKAEECVERCHEFGIEPYISILVGNDEDDEGIFDRVLEFTHKSKIVLAEFVVATPYPGTPSWKRLLSQGRIIDRTWKRYNDANVVFQPAQMSPERLQEGYLTLWREFYKDKQHLQNAEKAKRTIQF